MWRRFLSLFLTFLTVGVAAEESSIVTGKPHEAVLTLTNANFAKAIDDPANPKWLLKFYAPWCGHCKRLAPILDQVAPEIAGKMAIGKVDCTQEKKLCNQHNVKSYPTLKFSLDGHIFDYPGGRKEGDIIAFANKINRPHVQMMDSMDSVMEYIYKESDEGVVFVAHHPALQGDTIDEQTQSTLMTQVFSQAARKMQAEGHFLLLQPHADVSSLEQKGEAPFICRVEAHVAPRCVENVQDIQTSALLDFAKAANVATVTALGPQNFHKIGRKGRPLVIGVVDSSKPEQIEDAKQRLTAFATTSDVRDKYYFGYFDGKQWQRFLTQFEVLPEDLPQVFLLNVPKKVFWQNATYGMDVENFMAAVKSGSISSRLAGKSGIEGALQRLYYAIAENRPWSVILLVLVVLALGVGLASCIVPGDDLRPPYNREVANAAVAEAKADDQAKENANENESKKDK